MNKKYLWRLQTVIVATLVSVGFASCCCDRNIEPPASEGDGLEGYWLEDLYKTKLETVEGETSESAVVEKQTYDDSNPGYLLYLDGKGGGTCYYRVCTEERWKSGDEDFQKKFTYKVGSFKDFMENTHTYYGYKQEALIYVQRGSTIILVVGNSNTAVNGSGSSSTISLSDLLANPNLTIGEVFGNTDTSSLDDMLEDATDTPPSMLNFSDGILYGYHRATKVE